MMRVPVVSSAWNSEMGFPYPVVPEIPVDGSEVRRKRWTGKNDDLEGFGKRRTHRTHGFSGAPSCSFARHAGFENDLEDSGGLQEALD